MILTTPAPSRPPEPSEDDADDRDNSRFFLAYDRHWTRRHYPFDFDISPWQENAIRLLEDQQ